MASAKEIQNRKVNARLYPIYKMISWDLLFYYSIIYLFLTQAKGFSASQVLLAEAVFTSMCLIIQIPVGILVEKIGKKRSLVFANVCMCLFTILLIFLKTYTQLFVAYFLDAIGYVIKCVCETNILYDSLPKGKKRGSLYSTLDGLGASRYYMVDAVTSLIAGYAFVISPYFPIVLCLIGNIISTILASRFKHTQMPDDDVEEKTSVKEYLWQLKNAVRFTKKSKRIACLLIFFGLVSGLIYNMTTFRSGILEQIELSAQYFGLVFAISQVAASLCSRMQNLIQKRYKNTTLAHLGIPLTVSCIMIGVLSLGKISNIKTYTIIALFILQGAIKGVYNVLIYRYLNNFTTKQIRTKLATVRNIVYNLFSIAISLIGAALLHFSNASTAIIIIGISMTIVMILLLDYMKDKVGLKPENYTKDDLKYSTLVLKK